MNSFKDGFRFMTEKIGQVIEVTNKNTSVLKTLAYKSIDLEARSRRNNLIFWGLYENYGENCFAVIRDFIINHLDLDANKMYLSRAHRLGPRKIGRQNPNRPIIVNFRDFCDTVAIMGKAHMLKNTPFSICYDQPKEINDARKKLWDELKLIKAKEPRVKFQIVYPAKLVIEGKVVRDEFPDWTQVMKGSRLVDFSHIDNTCSYDQSSLYTPEQSIPSQQIINGSNTRDTAMNEMFTNANVAPRDCEIMEHQSESGYSVSHSLGNGQQSSAQPGSVYEAELPSPGSSSPDSVSMQSGGTAENVLQHHDSRSPSRESSVTNNEKNDKPLIQSPIFRPIPSIPNSTETTTSNSKQQNSSQSGNFSERVSRSVQRGQRRINSLSVTRTNQNTSRDSEEKPVSSKNKQSGARNNSNQKQSQQNGSRGVSKSPHGSKNRSTGKEIGMTANTQNS